MKYIEVFGLCGAGKSTLFEILRQRYPEHHIIKNDELRLSPISIKKMYIHVFLHILKGDPLTAIKLVMDPDKRWLLSKLCYRMVLTAEYKITYGIIEDSGCYQPFITYLIEKENSNNFISFMSICKLLPLPSAAVFVEVEPEIAYQRYIKREAEEKNRIKRTNLKLDDLLPRFHAANKICYEMIDYLNNNNIRTLKINLNNKPDEATLSDISVNLSNMIQTQ